MNNETPTSVQLCNGRSIHPLFLERIRSAVMERIPTLKPHRIYSLRKICGDDFWELLEEGEQEKAGLCMSHLVTKHEVPMHFAGKDSHNANTYQLD